MNTANKDGVVKGARGSWSRALATSLPVLLGQGLVYVYVIDGLGAERVVGAVIGLMLLAPLIVALVHVASQGPSRRPAAKANFRGLRPCLIASGGTAMASLEGSPAKAFPTQQRRGEPTAKAKPYYA